MDTTGCMFQVTAGCPAQCTCPEEPERCAPGVSALMDACGCCKVCAAQLNQDCGPARPCDHHKGLECNYGNDVTVAWGICRGERAAGAQSSRSFTFTEFFFAEIGEVETEWSVFVWSGWYTR